MDRTRHPTARWRLGADWSALHRKPPGWVSQHRLVASDPIGAGVGFRGREPTRIEPQIKPPRRPGWCPVAGAAEVLDDCESLQRSQVKARAVGDRPGTRVAD